jgi:hypothetical protein
VAWSGWSYIEVHLSTIVTGCHWLTTILFRSGYGESEQHFVPRF